MHEPDVGGDVESAGESAPSTRRRRRMYEAAHQDAAAPSDGAPIGGTAGGPAREPLPGGRRDRRRQETARKALAAGTGEHAARPTASGTGSPFSVDETVAARQKTLAERAAALTARARRVHDLSEHYLQNRRTSDSDDPASLHSLSIVVTPTVGVAPGDGTALLSAPITSDLPLGDLRAGRPEATRADRVRLGVSPQVGTSGLVPTSDPGPVEARSAFGLEPLDAMTAGLGRVRRLRLLQYSLLGVGGAALLTGIMMTVSSLNG